MESTLKASRYLNRITLKRLQILKQCEIVRRRRNAAMRLTHACGIGSGNSRAGSMEELIADAVDRQARVKALICEWKFLAAEINESLRKLDDRRQAMLLGLVYVRGLSASTARSRMALSQEEYLRLKQEALTELGRLI